MLAFLEAVTKRMPEVRPELVANAQAWVAWAEENLARRRPLDRVFLEPLLDRDSSQYFYYTGHYGERDDWFLRW